MFNIPNPWRKFSLSVLTSSTAVLISSLRSPMGWIPPPFRRWLADCQFQWHQWEFQPPTADPLLWPRREASSSQLWIGPSEPSDALWLRIYMICSASREKKRMQVDVSWCKSCEAQLGISPRFDAQLGISNCWGIHAWQARVACYFAYQMDGGMLGRESQLCAVRSVKHVKQSECWNFLPCLPHIYHIFTIYFP